MSRQGLTRNGESLVAFRRNSFHQEEQAMKTHTFVLRTALGLLVGALAFGLPAAGKDKKAAPAKNSPRVRVGPYQLSGPHTYKNLTIYLIHGADQFKGKKLLT